MTKVEILGWRVHLNTNVFVGTCAHLHVRVSLSQSRRASSMQAFLTRSDIKLRNRPINQTFFLTIHVWLLCSTHKLSSHSLYCMALCAVVAYIDVVQ